METPGEFVEIAIVEGNKVELQKEVMQKVFGHPDLQDCQIAIFSVFGTPLNKISRFSGEMLKYLLEKNGVAMDGSMIQQILEFGTNAEENKPCIVTWAKPFFISKGLKNAAVFLLDIKGTFSDSYDQNYIMLSGLCSFMSSSCLYLCNGNRDGYLKHIESIALEGIRHLGKKKSVIHQKMTVVMENWSATDNFTYGDKDGISYTKHLEAELKAPQNKIFGAFEEFTFFFLPKDDNPMYSHFYNKLFMVTLDRCYIVPKKIGAFLKPLQILDDVRKYVDEMDDDVFKGALSDFLKRSSTSVQLETKPAEEIQKTNSKGITHEKSKKSISLKSPKSTSSVEKENSLQHENTLLKNNINLETSSLKLGESADSSEEDVAVSAKDLKTAYSHNENSIFSECKTLIASISNSGIQLLNTGDTDDEELNITHDAKVINTSYIVTNEIFDLSKYLEDLSPNQPKNEEMNKSLTENPLLLLSPEEILHNTAEAWKTVPAVRRTNVSALKESNLQVSPGSDLISVSKSKTFENPSQGISSSSNIASTPVVRSDKQNKSTSNMNRNTIGPNNISNDEINIEIKLIHIFRQTGLQSGTSAVDIIRQLTLNLETHTTDISKKVEKYRHDINEAILAVLVYIDNMESNVKTCFNLCSVEFENLHRQNSDLAFSHIGNASFLKESVVMKINEAKRIFRSFNSKNTFEKDNLMWKALEEMRKFYREKMNFFSLSFDEEFMTLQHQKLYKSVIEAAENSCQANKSTWSKDLLENLKTELENEFQQFKRDIRRQKMAFQRFEKDTEICISFYKSEMKRNLQATDVNIEQLHSKILKETIDKFKDVVGKIELLKNPNSVKKLQTELEITYNLLKEGLLKNPNQYHPSSSQQNISVRTNGAKIEETLMKTRANSHLHNTEVTADAIHNGTPIHFIGIDFNFTEIIASVFKPGGIEEIFRKKDPSIGFDEEIIWQTTPPNSGGWRDGGRSIVNLNCIFESIIGGFISVNWDGNKTFVAEELLSLFFSLIKSESEKKIGYEVNVCAVSVPSYFHEIEIEAINIAAKISGFQTVQILRDICSATIGSRYFKNSSGNLPTDFIAINMYSKTLDAGFYNLSKSFSPSVLSGDNYVPVNHSSFFRWNPKLKDRFRNIILDITRQVEDAAITNVIIIGEEQIFKEVTEQKELSNFKFYRVHRPSIQNGAALVAALSGNNSVAQDFWKKNSPVALSATRGLDEFLNHRWTKATLTSRSSSHSKKGSNIHVSSIPEIQRKLKPYLRRELYHDFEILQ